MFTETEYALKYKNEIVFTFDTQQKTIQMMNISLLPLSLQNKPITYDLVKKFCSDRVLVLNRQYWKEILAACGADENNDVNICILCKALSFRDNYWISSVLSTETWEQCNLYQNEFSIMISKIALTGKVSEDVLTGIEQELNTGELTNKGTKAKCYYRNDGRLFLIKRETREEIMSEIVMYHIAQALGVSCARYEMVTMFDCECSMCEILTSEMRELIPCRDILSYYNTNIMTWNDECYHTFMNVDHENFIKMQILDYVTLNVDRNRDNFGLLASAAKFRGLYPLFDHDSCFKGKSIQGTYFPTGVTFAQTLELLKTNYGCYYQDVYNDIQYFKYILSTPQWKQIFLNFKSEQEYVSMMERVQHL